MRALVPQPTSVHWGSGSFELGPKTTVGGAGESERLRWLLARFTGLVLDRAQEGDIEVLLDPSHGDEGYRLSVTPEGVRVWAGSTRGVSWATQTLMQLLPDESFAAPAGGTWTIPAVDIIDQPRFSWRGGMLDCSRYFMPMTDVLNHLEWMARHKFNVFHWHLTDDQGWRFESLRYPRLSTHAAWRAESSTPQWGGDGTPHGGFYTQEQVLSVVRHADALGIEVVPEIEFPGHLTAALAAHPEFSAAEHPPVAVSSRIGIHENVMNFSPEALGFVTDIWHEVLEVTGARTVHIGGDEVPTVQWRTHEPTREHARQHCGGRVDEVQNWFTRYLRDWLVERGVRPIGWDEVIDHGPLEGVICQVWRGPEYAERAVQSGMQVIMSPRQYTYFDYYQADTDDEPYAMGSLLPLDKAYAFDPLDGLEGVVEGQVLGTQFQIWTEYIADRRQVEYATWPRACAHAEVAWSSPAGRDFAEFEARLARHLGRFEAAGLNHRPLAGPHPWQRAGSGRRRRPSQPLDLD